MLTSPVQSRLMLRLLLRSVSKVRTACEYSSKPTSSSSPTSDQKHDIKTSKFSESSGYFARPPVDKWGRQGAFNAGSAGDYYDSELFFNRRKRVIIFSFACLLIYFGYLR